MIYNIHDLIDDFEARAHVKGVSDAAVEIEEIYASESPILAALCPLITRSRHQAHVQDQLNAERERLHHGHLSHEERIAAGHHYEMLRHAACEYNHMLRGFIESHQEGITRDELTAALVQSSHGHERWAEGEITGAISEIALHAALMGMPELTDVRYATLDEDLRGFDFSAEWRGRQVTIDAKTGRYLPVVEPERGHWHLEIYVPREAVDGFKITRHGLDNLRREVRVALSQAKRMSLSS